MVVPAARPRESKYTSCVDRPLHSFGTLQITANIRSTAFDPDTLFGFGALAWSGANERRYQRERVDNASRCTASSASLAAVLSG